MRSPPDAARLRSSIASLARCGGLESFHPVAMNWVVTDQCPLRCSYCLNGFHEPGPQELDLEQRLRIVEAASSLGVRRFSIMGGEPFILKDLPELVEYARRNDIDVNITTSGIVKRRAMLEALKPGVEYLNVSIDGDRAATDHFRGDGTHARAVEFAELARSIGIRLRLYTVLSRLSGTPAGIESIARLARRLEVQTLMLISFSPLREAHDRHDLRFTKPQRQRIFENLRQELGRDGIQVKEADPYEPENQKIFINPFGALYVPQGRQPRKMVGHLLEEPSLAFSSRLPGGDARQHMRQYSDREARPRHRRMERLGPAGMVWVPAGIFIMGGGIDRRSNPAHPVYVSGFYIDVKAIDQAQFARFLNTVGRRCSDDGRSWIELDRPECLITRTGGEYRVEPGAEALPAVCVTWYGAHAYASWLGRRLPTEAEREKAARGGLEGASYPWGDEPPAEQCNWLGYTGRHRDRRADFYKRRGPLPGGLFEANGWGLYDMAGNVWEWCDDWLDKEIYGDDLRVDPRGPDRGRFKVARGGAYSFDPVNLRCAHRSYALPGGGYPWTGFRTVIGGADWLLRTYRKNRQEDESNGRALA